MVHVMERSERSGGRAAALLVVIALGIGPSARAADAEERAAQGERDRGRPSTVDYVDGTVGME